jgi:hypothetical protein
MGLVSYLTYMHLFNLNSAYCFCLTGLKQGVFTAVVSFLFYC